MIDVTIAVSVILQNGNWLWKFYYIALCSGMSNHRSLLQVREAIDIFLS